MLQRRTGFGLANQPEFPFLVENEIEWEELERDQTVEARVARLIHDAHTAGAQPGNDDVLTQRSPDQTVGLLLSDVSKRADHCGSRKEGTGPVMRRQELLHLHA